MKKIELEADNFVKNKHNKFNTELNKEVRNLNSYILNNLHDCREKERAKERLMAVSYTHLTLPTILLV